MQRLSIDSLEPGMITHHRVYSGDGKVLLGSQVPLTASYIQGIKRMGVASITINNPIVESIGITYEETLSQEAKMQAVQVLKEAFEDAKKGKMLNLYKVSSLAKLILNSVKYNQLIRLDNSVIAEDYLYLHCVNVAALVTVIAYDMGYNEGRLNELIMGALLHDIGYALLEKETGFTDSDDNEHATVGFDYVRKLRGYSIVSGHIVFQHHERWDGKGYPRGLKEEDIHEYARITAIADTYDLLVTDRSGREPLLPHQAYEAIMAMSLDVFDKQIADTFLHKIPLYPVGTFVEMDTGHIGVVTKALPKLQSRPTVAMIADPAGVFFEKMQEVDLTKFLTTFIARVLSEKEIVELTRRFEETVR